VSLKRAQRGQLMVEVAVVFPLLVFVALGLVQFALYYHAHNVVQTAVQEAARVAARQDASLQEGEARGQALIRAGWNRGDRVNVSMASINYGEPDEMVQASVNTVYPTFFPAFSFSTGLTHLDLPLSASARISKERFRGGQ
jgi:Flp pilus assembly protein TadG